MNATDLQTGMRMVARAVGATQEELTQQWAENAPDVLWQRLTGHKRRWLLILDNADEPELLTPAGEPVAAGRGWLREPPGLGDAPTRKRGRPSPARAAHFRRGHRPRPDLGGTGR